MTREKAKWRVRPENEKEEFKDVVHDTLVSVHNGTIDDVCDDFEKQLLKKDCEIAKYQGMLKAMKSEVFRLHPTDCNCANCEEQRSENIK